MADGLEQLKETIEENGEGSWMKLDENNQVSLITYILNGKYAEVNTLLQNNGMNPIVLPQAKNIRAGLLADQMQKISPILFSSISININKRQITPLSLIDFVDAIGLSFEIEDYTKSKISLEIGDIVCSINFKKKQTEEQIDANLRKILKVDSIAARKIINEFDQNIILSSLKSRIIPLLFKMLLVLRNTIGYLKIKPITDNLIALSEKKHNFSGNEFKQMQDILKNGSQLKSSQSQLQALSEKFNLVIVQKLGELGEDKKVADYKQHWISRQILINAKTLFLSGVQKKDVNSQIIAVSAIYNLLLANPQIVELDKKGFDEFFAGIKVGIKVAKIKNPISENLIKGLQDTVYPKQQALNKQSAPQGTTTKILEKMSKKEIEAMLRAKSLSKKQIEAMQKDNSLSPEEKNAMREAKNFSKEEIEARFRAKPFQPQ